jgi:hypothetical protein
MYRVLSLLIPIALCLGGTVAVIAQSPSKESVEWPWPAVDANTACIARFKLSALNVKAISSKLAALVPENEKQMFDVQVMLSSGLLAQLTQAGADEVYFLGSTKQLATDNALIVPCSDEKMVGELLQMFVNEIPKEFAYEIQREAGVFAICNDHVWKRILGRRTALKSNDATKGNDALSTEDSAAITHWQSITESLASSHWAAVSLPEPLREELSLLWPNEMQVGDSHVSLSGMVKDTRSLTLSADANEQLQAVVALNCVDVSAAERVEAQVNTVVQFLPKALDDVKIPQPAIKQIESQVLLTWEDLYTAIELTARHTSENSSGGE